jgi:hypothetical protein
MWWERRDLAGEGDEFSYAADASGPRLFTSLFIVRRARSVPC